MSDKKQWSELSTRQKSAIVVAGSFELLLTAWAVRDLARRPSSEVRGPKLLWVASFAVQPLGPISYAALGRRRS